MDEESLRSLGFHNLSELMAESADFADLFVRTPGFIHNFKYVHWIDYITYGGTTDTPKAIIHTKAKDFWCNIEIKTAYMTDSPAAKGYIIYLTNLRELSQSEKNQIIADIEAKPQPYAVEIEEAPFIHPSVKENIKKSIAKQNQELQAQLAQTSQQPTTPPKQVITTPQQEEEKVTIPLQEENLLNDENTTSSPEKEEIQQETSPQEASPQGETQGEENESIEHELGVDPDYVYDPQIASNDLGLPVDLIEEFIEDFIVQAKEFKDDLYKYLDEEDLNNVRILSHKLKGVAANLRVENAFHVLATINTSEDFDEIRKNLDYFYVIIAKLNGEEPVEIAVKDTQENEEEDDILPLDFKDDEEIIVEESKEQSQKQEIQKQEKEQNDDAPLDILVQEDKEEEVQETKEDKQTTPPIYDKESVIQELQIAPNDFDELLSDYLVDTKDIAQTMLDDIASNNEEKWKKGAKKLKGMSENMRTYHLISKEIETLLETSQQDVAKEAINSIIKTISNIKV